MSMFPKPFREFPRRFIYAGADYTRKEHPVAAPYFRRAFCVKKGSAASLIIAGLGFYELYFNGKKLTKGHMAPYISCPDDLVYYDRYDLSQELLEGENVLGILLGNGFQNNPGGYVWDFDDTPWTGAPRTALCLSLTDPEGHVTKIEGDEQFRTAPSPILMDDYRWGEWYDARKEKPGWCLPGYDDSSWAAALPAPTPAGDPILCGCEPIRKEKELLPVAVVKEEAGWRYEFAENNSGVCRLTLRNTQPGQVVELRHGEYIKDGRLEMGNIKFEAALGKDDLVQMDRYICKGAAVETFTPHFTYHGFQYVLVTGIRADQALPDLLTYLVLHSDVEERGGFTCSDQTADRLQEITRRSDLSNLFYFPNDCPHREKNGWAADAALSSEHMLLNLGVERCYQEWLHNISRAMDAKGALPGVIPTGGWGFFWGNGPAWDNVLFYLTYFTYRYRGDRTVIQENAAAMMRYLHYIGTRIEEDGLIAFGLGDWCPVGPSNMPHQAPLRFTDSVLTADMAEKAAYLFGQIGMAREQAFANDLHAHMIAAIRENLVDLSTMTVAGNCQTSQAMALYYGVFTPAERPAAFARLLEFIDQADYHMRVGVLGGRVLFHVLTQFGRSDLAFQMITRPDFPSYGDWVRRGATTLWENFFPEGEQPSSMNHHFWGDISGWFIQALAGIRVNPKGRSVSEIDLRPSFIPQLSYAEGFHIAPAGRVWVRWERQKDTVLLKVEAPKEVYGSISLEPGWQFENGLSYAPMATGEYCIHKEKHS